MRLIQPLLLAAFIGALFGYLRFLRSSVRDRAMAVLFFIVASLAVILPDLTEDIAHMVGVGRGTDLTLYVFIVGFVFFALLTYGKVIRVHRTLTEIIRRIAILEASGDRNSPTGRHADRT